jgi:hypothetical protein
MKGGEGGLEGFGGLIVRGESGWLQLCEGVAFFVEVEVGEAELVEAVEEPGGAVVFGEGGRGDANELELPLAELGLMEVQPVEGAMDGGEAGEPGDSALCGGGGHQ